MVSIVARVVISLIGWTTSIDVEHGAWGAVDSLLIVPLAIGGIGLAVSYIRWETDHQRRVARNATSDNEGQLPRTPPSAARVTARYFGDALTSQLIVVVPGCAIFFGLRYTLMGELGDIGGSIVAALATAAWLPLGLWLLGKHIDRELAKESIADQ
jgi:hypothetical protein